MKGFKGYNKGLICRGYQFKENEVFEEGKAEICKNGFHFCENPFDVLDYYGYVNGNSELNEFTEVEALDETFTDDNEKYCTKKIKIGAKINIAGFIKAGVEFILSKVEKVESNTGDYSASTNTGYKSASTNTGYKSASTNTGDYSASTNTGNNSASTNTGNNSASTNTGYKSASTNTGNNSASTNTGNNSASTNTGYKSASTNTGYKSASTNTGNNSASTNTGYKSASTVEGKESVAVAIGYESKAKGSLGCWIALSEWDENAEHIINFKSHKVDGKTIKADTFYILKNGKFVECKEM